MMSPSVTPDLVAQKLRDAHGNIAAAAISLKVSRQALYRYIDKYQTLKAVLQESRESMKDMVESVLYQKALEGESWAVCFFLKTQAKDRGYVERTEHTGADGGAINVRDASQLSDDELAAIATGRRAGTAKAAAVPQAPD